MKIWNDNITKDDSIRYDVRYTRFRDDRKVELFAAMGVRDEDEIIMQGSIWFIVRCDGQRAEWLIIHNERGMTDESAFMAASAANMGRRHSSISFSTIGRMKAYIARRDALRQEMQQA